MTRIRVKKFGSEQQMLDLAVRVNTVVILPFCVHHHDILLPAGGDWYSVLLMVANNAEDKKFYELKGLFLVNKRSTELDVAPNRIWISGLVCPLRRAIAVARMCAQKYVATNLWIVSSQYKKPR